MKSQIIYFCDVLILSVLIGIFCIKITNIFGSPEVYESFHTLFGNDQNELIRNITLYNKPTLFQLFGTEVETATLSIFSPECVFDNTLNEYDCKKYIKIFVDMDCTFSQTSTMINYTTNPKFLLYLSPETYNTYDARLKIHNQTNCSWLQLAQSIACQSNNVCVFVTGFTLSYNDWSDVPPEGNNVTLNCSTFYVYAYS